MSWGAIGGAVIGGVMASRAAKKSAAGVQAGQQITQEQWQQGREDLSPYREAGEWGLGQYRGMLEQDTLPKWGGFTAADMEQDPGYQFRLQQGYQGLERMAARGGERFSGKLGIGLQDYGQRMASQEFGAARGRSLQDYTLRRQEGMQRMSQFANLAGSGQQAAGAQSQLGANYASSMAGLSQQAGQAQAAGYLGMGAAAQGGIAGYQYQQNFDKYMGGQPGLASYSTPYQYTGTTAASPAGEWSGFSRGI